MADNKSFNRTVGASTSFQPQLPVNSIVGKEEMHPDYIPFVAIGICGCLFLVPVRRLSGFRIGSFIACLVSMLAGVSNGNRWPVPYRIEMGAIYASPVVLVACLLWAVFKHDRKELNVARWVLWPTAFVLAAAIAAWMYVLSRLP